MSQIKKDDEINTYKFDVFDTQKIQDTFVEWFSQFKENVIDKEFENGSKGEGVIVKSKNGLTFEFSTKWRVSIEKVDDEDGKADGRLTRRDGQHEHAEHLTDQIIMC